MTEYQRAVLYQKFNRDVAKRSRANRSLLAFDQLCNAVFWNGSQDETISSHIHRRKMAGTATWWDERVCCALSRLEYNHCFVSRGE